MYRTFIVEKYTCYKFCIRILHGRLPVSEIKELKPFSGRFRRHFSKMAAKAPLGFSGTFDMLFRTFFWTYLAIFSFIPFFALARGTYELIALDYTVQHARRIKSFLKHGRQNNTTFIFLYYVYYSIENIILKNGGGVIVPSLLNLRICILEQGNFSPSNLARLRRKKFTENFLLTLSAPNLPRSFLDMFTNNV